jgi:hypothetical protein
MCDSEVPKGQKRGQEGTQVPQMVPTGQFGRGAEAMEASAPSNPACPSPMPPAVVLACGTEEGPFSHSKMFMSSDEIEMSQSGAVAPSPLPFQGFDTSGSPTNSSRFSSPLGSSEEFPGNLVVQQTPPGIHQNVAAMSFSPGSSQQMVESPPESPLNAPRVGAEMAKSAGNEGSEGGLVVFVPNENPKAMPSPCLPLPSLPFALSPLPLPTFAQLQQTYTMALCSQLAPNKSKIPKMPQIIPGKSEESLGQKSAQNSRIAQIPGEILAETSAQKSGIAQIHGEFLAEMSAQTVSPPEMQRSYGSGVVGLPGATLAAGGLSPPPQGYQSWPQPTTRGHPPALPAPMPVPRQPAADRCKGGDVEGRSHGSRGCNFPDGTFAAPSLPIEESPIGLGEHKRHLATPVSSVGSVGGKCQRLENTETPPPATDAVMEIPENVGPPRAGPLRP